MIPWLKKLFTDEGSFTGMVRAGLVGVGIASTSGTLPIPAEYEWLGAVAAGVGVMLRSSHPIGKSKPPES
jgi:hypothetical protein